MSISTPASVATPVPSATVVLARDGAIRPELLLVLRHAKASFGSTYVFPGGVLDRDDGRVTERCTGIDQATASATLDLPAGGIAYYSAAIRELFEEAGVLLARTPSGGWADADALGRYRDALNEGRESWGGFLARFDLRLTCDALHYFAFWITPRELGRRFSTRFFLAKLPAGQVASHCGTELTDSRWMSADQALAVNEAREIDLPFPTVSTLDALCQFDDTGTMLAWADRQSRGGVECRRPAMIVVDGERRFVMPGEAGYPDYEDPG